VVAHPQYRSYAKDRFDIVDTTGLRREARGWRKPLIRKATQQSLGPRLRVAQLAAPIPGDRRAVVGK
jgi:hypothetical protein